MTITSSVVAHLSRTTISASALGAVMQRSFRAEVCTSGYSPIRFYSNEDSRSPEHSASRHRGKFFDRRSLGIHGATSSNESTTLEDLSDAQLRAKLVERGCLACPVTPTTRKVLIKKLEGVSASKNGCTEESNEESGNAEKSPLKIAPDLRQSAANPTKVQSPQAYNTATPKNSPTSSSDLESWDTSAPDGARQPQILFFDIETSGLEVDCDILQISVRRGSATWNRYVKPTRPIAAEASRVNRLYNRSGDLYRNDERLDSQPLRLVLAALRDFLRTFGKRCILVAHNCPFDATRLVAAVRRNSMEAEFAAVVDGFADTLRLFREKYPERRRRKGALKLTTLAESLDLRIEGAHDAHYDTFLLEKLTREHFEPRQLLEIKTSFERALARSLTASRG